jgi:CDP-paratose 2-epimerase
MGRKYEEVNMKWLITGGAGFIGSNTANSLLQSGDSVVIVDNLSRAGSEKNLDWLYEQHGSLPFWQVDVRNYEELKQILREHPDVDVILHLAAQVAVTTSVANPREDFEINALGTLNVLEAVREMALDPVILYASTNKVYGGMDQVAVVDDGRRYRYANLPQGISESTPLDFHSPYGCSKGTADQYVRDYHRIYGLRTIVFRNSCIYGQRQFGIEDQGWVAWFVIAAVMNRPITIYGDGKQIRDVLYIDDLVNAFALAIEHIEVTQGQVYNMGGGPANTLAIWSEFEPLLGRLLGEPVGVVYADWRPGDQKVYVSDVSKARRDFDWQPKLGVEEGVQLLFNWVTANRHLFNEETS